jgi:hypothetical protein
MPGKDFVDIARRYAGVGQRVGRDTDIVISCGDEWLM